MEINAEKREMFLAAYVQLESKLSFMQLEMESMEHTKQRLEALEAIMATAEKNERGAFVERKISSRVNNMNYELERKAASAICLLTSRSLIDWDIIPLENYADEQKGQ